MKKSEKGALDVIFGEWLRPYQKAFLGDFSAQRCILKSRRIGLSDAAALDVVLTTSGLWQHVVGAPVFTHNYNVISKRDIDAKQFIRYCKKWISLLRKDPQLAPWLACKADGYSATHITFDKSGFRIQSDTQSPGAGRGAEGHLMKDESAWYPYAREIVAGADKVPLSDPRLRITEISTPNGTAGQGEVFWLKYTSPAFADYSRHHIDIDQAIADGFPITAQQARDTCLSDDEYRQEFGCEFTAGAAEYFSRSLLEGSLSAKPNGEPDFRCVGIDVASERDLTALVTVERYGAACWISAPLLVSGLPYETGPAGIGQDAVIAAYCRHLAPDCVIIDASGDGAILYGRLLHSLPGVNLKPHSFHKNGREWKLAHVPRMRHDMEQGLLCITDAYGQRFTGPNADDWAAQNRPVMVEDFLSVQRKQLDTGPTFSSPRTKDGHADAFWAACMAFSITANSERSEQSQMLARLLTSDTSAPQTDSYTDYL